MVRYRNQGGASGVRGYEIDDEGIKVKFHDNAVYLYTAESAGSENILEMKRLAEAGKGLEQLHQPPGQEALREEDRVAPAIPEHWRSLRHLGQDLPIESQGQPGPSARPDPRAGRRPARSCGSSPSKPGW